MLHVQYLSLPPEPEKSSELLKKCLEEGYINLSSLKGVLTGKARSGKTLSRARLFNMALPSVHASTGVVEGALVGSTGVAIAGVRDISHTVLQGILGEWFSLSPQEMLKLLAGAVHAGLLVGDLAEIVQESAEKLGLDVVHSELQTAPTVTSLPSRVQEICTARQDMASLIEASAGNCPVLELQLLHLLDSGGQPQFHEVFPAFIHQTALVLLTLKLSETLDAQTKLEFCDERGDTYKQDCACLLSNEEILEHQATTLKAMSSRPEGDKRMKFAVIGTHRDEEEKMIKEGKCKERTAKKNKKLRHIFLPMLMGMLILFRPPDKIIFPVNVLNPTDDDNRVLRVLRERIMDADLFTTVKIPIGWFLLKQDILRFAAEKGRKIIRVSECVLIAANLKINAEVLEAALLYFHSLNIFLYVPHVLPGILFTNPQTPLSCVYEFVSFQFRLSCGAIEGVEALHYDNLMKGIVTFDFLNSRHFSKNFVSGLYEPQHALKLFQSLFIASPLGIGKYLLPFLLPMISKTDIHKYRPSRSNLPALMVRFKTVLTSEVTCSPNGLFCGLVASLISTYKWIIKETYDETKTEHCTVCMARNVVILAHNEIPGSLTLINMQDFFEVHIEADQRVLPHLCPKLYQMIFSGINDVLKSFKYIDCTPVLAYRCPCNPESHPAEPKEYEGVKMLRCTRSQFDQPWNEKFELWGEPSTPDTESETSAPIQDISPIDSASDSFSNSSYGAQESDFALSKLDAEPTLVELSHFKTKIGETVEIIPSLAPKWQEFATELDFDAEGRQLQLFKAEPHGPLESCRNVLMHWLAGNGKQPSTWRTLISLLRSSSVGEKKLASKLEMDLC